MRKTRSLKKLSELKSKPQAESKEQKEQKETKPTENKINPKTDLKHRVEELKKSFGHSYDFTVREITFGENNDKTINIIYLHTLVNTAIINESIISPLMGKVHSKDLKITENFVKDLTNIGITNAFYEISTDIIYASHNLLNAKAIVLIDGYEEVVLLEVSLWQERSLQESKLERSFYGIGIGFTEHTNSNINIIRGLVKSEHLVFEKHEIGNNAKTDVYVIYMKDLVEQKFLTQINQIFSEIDLNYVIDSRVIQKYIIKKIRLFPLILKTDRPDTVTSILLQGRIVIMVDGNPFALGVPAFFIDFFQSPMDYEDNYGRFTFRLTRMINYFMAIFLPAIYIAFVKEDYELPKHVAKSLMPSGELISTFMQMILLTFLLRSILDANMRISQNAVVLVTMLGTVIVGETLTQVHIIHPMSLVITGFIFVAGSSVGNKGLQASFSSLRLFYIFVANFFGFNGLIIGSTLQLIFMTNIKILGVPYMSPFIPFRPRDLRDSLFRGNLKKIINKKHKY